MSNKRMINSDLFEDEDIGVLDIFKRYLWVGLITSVADDQGRFIDNPAIIKAKVFPYDTDLSDKDVEKALESFDGKIYRYEKNGKHLVQIVNWWKYQAPSWAAPSKYTAPDRWVDRVHCHGVGNKVITENFTEKGGWIDSVLPMPVGSAIDEGEVKSEDDGEDDVEHAPDGATEESMTTDAIKKGDLVDLHLLGMKKPADHILDYPPDVQDILREFIAYFPLDVPSRRDRRGYGFWCKDLIALKQACGEYGVDIIRELHADWLSRKYNVSHPSALCNTARSKVMEKRAGVDGKKVNKYDAQADNYFRNALAEAENEHPII